MLLRLSIGSGICVLLAALIYLQGEPPSAVITSARNLLGEHWYELELKEERVGYLHTQALRDSSGSWRYRSELRFALTPGEPVTLTDQLVFDATPPYHLREAVHQNKRHDRTETVTIDRSSDGYSATIANTGNTASEHRKDLDWQYDLEDYLAFETWLNLSNPGVGALKTVPTLDFARLDIVFKRYRIIDHNQTGYQVENPAPFDSTSIQLDHNYVPVALEVSGLFTLKHSSRDRALGPRSALQTASYYIPTDRPLTDHKRIERMVLGVHGGNDAQGLPSNLWSSLESNSDGWTLTLHANPLSENKAYGSGLEETLGFPVSSRRIARLAHAAVGDLIDDAARVAALNRFVHRYLTYVPGAPSQPVLALLDHPIGDCTEFADLFTTLARSLNIPAQTVFGLAYADTADPAFAFHAWNEVSIDGVWQSVDPTWNQIRVDATHIPLPANQNAAMQLLTGSIDLNFSVREVDYFTDA